jgi:hypothetical protein
MNIYEFLMTIGFFGLVTFSAASLIISLKRLGKVRSFFEILMYGSDSQSLKNKLAAYFYFFLTVLFVTGLLGSLYGT